MSTLPSASSSAASAPHWHHPHQSCGAYTGPLDPVKPPPILDPEWIEHVVKTPPDYSHMADTIAKIHAAVPVHAKGYERLEHLCTEFGARISGSAILERAIDWAEKAMLEDGLENVRTEEAMVPQWVRGTAQCEVQVYSSDSPDKLHRRIHLDVLAVGLSVGTVPIEEARKIETAASSHRASGMVSLANAKVEVNPAHVITAPLLVVESFEELDALVAKDANVAKGKIILFNNRFVNYSLNVPYRGLSAGRAAAVGALAAIIRSVTPISLYTPHTGSMQSGISTPVVCCTTEDAEVLSKLAARGKRLVCSLYSSCFLNPDVKSRNILAEIKGRENPDEVVVIGAHIDSWDVGQGAHDDGQGCMVAWDVISVLLKMGLRPRRTIRCVLFTDEEVTSSGGAAYLTAHKNELKKVQAVMETDLGAYTATGFGWTGNDEGKIIIREVMKLLTPYAADKIATSGPGVDVRPMANEGVPAMLLWFPQEWTYTEYFAFHHTDADTFDKIDPSMMQQNTQIFAMMAYLLAEIPERIPHSKPITQAGH